MQNKIKYLKKQLADMTAERDYFKNQTAELADYIEKMEPSAPFEEEPKS